MNSFLSVKRQAKRSPARVSLQRRVGRSASDGQPEAVARPIGRKKAVLCPVANSVALQVLKRAEVGLKKYGVTAARQDLSLLQWLQHLQEELLDAAFYVERLKLEARGTDAASCKRQRALPANVELTHRRENQKL